MIVALLTQHAQRIFLPLALLYLKVSLVERGGLDPDRIPILEFPAHASADEIEQAVLASAPDVLAISCYVWNVRTLGEVARRVKARLPHVRIVMGGPEVGPIAAATLERHPWVDAVVKSEGEIPLVEMTGAWRSGAPLSAVRGICCRDGAAIVDTGEAALVKDLDEYPSPHLARYIDGTGRSICLETQRGCVFRCSFCFYNKDYSLRNRRFDLDRVKAELTYWLGQNVDEIYLMDPVFNLNSARAKEICRFIAANNVKRIPVHAEIWAEFVDGEMAELMRAANFQFLEVGLQTTDATALATVERRLKMQQFLAGLAHLRRCGLHYELQLIHGLPGETAASFRKSLNFAMSLDPPALSVFRLMVLPGTELWRSAERLALRFEPDPPYFALAHRTMSEEDFAWGARVTLANEELHQWRTVRLLAKERGLTYDAVLDRWISWKQETGRPATAAGVESFVADVCRERGIPFDFYGHVLRLELPADRGAGQRLR